MNDNATHATYAVLITAIIIVCVTFGLRECRARGAEQNALRLRYVEKCTSTPEELERAFPYPGADNR